MRQGGFTLVELIIVIVMIGILITISVFTQNNVLSASRDSERADDVASIARLLEDGYTNQVTGSPSYPTAGSFVDDAKNGTGIASTADVGIFRSPNALSSSVVAATTTAATDPAGQGTPTTSQYVYQPIDASGGLCSDASDTCVKFKLYFKNEVGGAVLSVKSAHQQ